MVGKMDVSVAKSWEGESGGEGDPEHRVIILLVLGRDGSMDQGPCFGVREGPSSGRCQVRAWSLVEGVQEACFSIPLFKMNKKIIKK